MRTGGARAADDAGEGKWQVNNNRNAPAYPLPLGDTNIDPSAGGMTKRELFAAMAMQANIIADVLVVAVRDGSCEKRLSSDELANESILDADALLAELEKKP